MLSMSLRIHTDLVPLRRLLAAGLLTLVITLIINILIGTVSNAIIPVSPAFSPLDLKPIFGWTTIGVVGAVSVFSVIGKLSLHPIQTFSKLAIIVLLISWIPDISLFFSSPFSDTSPAAIIVLMLMHLSTALLSIGFLTTLGVESVEPQASLQTPEPEIQIHNDNTS